MFFKRKSSMPSPQDALKGRSVPIETSRTHFANNRSLFEPYPEGTELAMFGAGCFWGVEKQYMSPRQVIRVDTHQIRLIGRSVLG